MDYGSTTAVLIGGYQQGKPKAKQPTADPATGEVAEVERWNDSVTVVDQTGPGRVIQYDLDPSINGDRPAVGTMTKLLVRAYGRSVQKKRKDGTWYHSRAFDLVCVGFEPVAVPARKAA